LKCNGTVCITETNREKKQPFQLADEFYTARWYAPLLWEAEPPTSLLDE
jgi:hypothetical protein